MSEKIFQLDNERLSPIIKWAGGKEKELKYIFSATPHSFNNYFEPFVGGGSIFTAMNAEHLFINDKSTELISLYKYIAAQDQNFFGWLKAITITWNSALGYRKNLTQIVDFYIEQRFSIQEATLSDLIKKYIHANEASLSSILVANFNSHRDFLLEIFEKTLYRKILRMQELEKEKGIMPRSDVQDNIETALMGSVYMYFRKLYNAQQTPYLQAALFVFIRNYAYSGMFRYSKNGDFNVPYGGIGYNKKTLTKKVEYYQTPALLQHFSKTTIMCADFMDFFNIHTPQENDFVFLDPPYDSEFSTYAQNQFTREDQKRLSDFLCNECKAKWLLIIKNTPFIMSLYKDKRLFMSSFDKKYQVSFMNRNNKNAEHLLISNYQHQ